MKRQSDNNAAESKWVHRCAVLLGLVTFPLIWVGGLVTTMDAGMAVPDWPNTYGYNMFLYPIETWIGGPWDLLIEHGHRLLGSLAGLVAIGLVIAAWRREQRGWVFWACVAALLLVIAQGTLGGIRVLAADRAIAKVHGCVGPAFFALTVAIIVVTSSWWHRTSAGFASLGTSFSGLSLAVLVLAYLQLVLGANMRHINVEADPMVFRSIVLFHVIGAVLTWLHAIALRWKAGRAGLPRDLLRPTTWLAVFVSLQLMLGLGTWVMKWGWPLGLAETAWLSGFVVPAKSMMQANIVTAHVAVGSLILATSVWSTLRLARATAFRSISISPKQATGVPA